MPWRKMRRRERRISLPELSDVIGYIYTSIWMERSASAMGRICVGRYTAEGRPWTGGERQPAVDRSPRGKVSHETFLLRLGIPRASRVSHFSKPRRLINLNRTLQLLLEPDIFTCYEQ
jgi:hypothetical protein